MAVLTPNRELVLTSCSRRSERAAWGEVWKARDTRLDRVVATKFSQTEFTDRFEHGARAIAALNHRTSHRSTTSVPSFTPIGMTRSPNGNWMFYQTDEAGQMDVYLESMPAALGGFSPVGTFAVTTLRAMEKDFSFWSRMRRLRRCRSQSWLIGRR